MFTLCAEYVEKNESSGPEFARNLFILFSEPPKKGLGNLQMDARKSKGSAGLRASSSEDQYGFSARHACLRKTRENMKKWDGNRQRPPQQHFVASSKGHRNLRYLRYRLREQNTLILITLLITFNLWLLFGRLIKAIHLSFLLSLIAILLDILDILVALVSGGWLHYLHCERFECQPGWSWWLGFRLRCTQHLWVRDVQDICIHRPNLWILWFPGRKNQFGHMFLPPGWNHFWKISNRHSHEIIQIRHQWMNWHHCQWQRLNRRALSPLKSCWHWSHLGHHISGLATPTRLTMIIWLLILDVFMFCVFLLIWLVAPGLLRVPTTWRIPWSPRPPRIPRFRTIGVAGTKGHGRIICLMILDVFMFCMFLLIWLVAPGLLRAPRTWSVPWSPRPPRIPRFRTIGVAGTKGHGRIICLMILDVFMFCVFLLIWLVAPGLLRAPRTWSVPWSPRPPRIPSFRTIGIAGTTGHGSTPEQPEPEQSEPNACPDGEMPCWFATFIDNNENNEGTCCDPGTPMHPSPTETCCCRLWGRWFWQCWGTWIKTLTISKTGFKYNPREPRSSC